MITVPVTQAVREGVTLTVPVVSDGQDLIIPDNDGNLLVEVTNGTGAAGTVTFQSQLLFAGDFVLKDLDVTVAAGSARWVGPLPPAVYNNNEGAVIVESPASFAFRGLRF